jgi:hypothetical protein
MFGQTFTPFPDLPLELRDNIWRLATPKPNLIVMTKKHEFYDLEFSYEVPSLLHVNREARRIALKSYKKICPVYLDKSPVYIDPSRDVLQFKDRETILRFISIMDVIEDHSLTNPMALNLSEVRFVAVGGLGVVGTIYAVLTCELTGIERLVLEKKGGACTKRYLDGLSYMARHAWFDTSIELLGIQSGLQLPEAFWMTELKLKDKKVCPSDV